MDGPTKYIVPTALREKLLKTALETDVIAEYRGIESWRVAAVSGARWLLRCAAECEDMPKLMGASLRQIASLSRRMSTQSSDRNVRTISGEINLELDKFLDEDE